MTFTVNSHSAKREYFKVILCRAGKDNLQSTLVKGGKFFLATWQNIKDVSQIYSSCNNKHVFLITYIFTYSKSKPISDGCVTDVLPRN